MSDSETEQITDLSSPEVTTKYMTAAGIANKALEAVIAACVSGADIASVCELGDKVITEEAAKLYNKKDKNGERIMKGVAFPTCVCPAEICGHYSPLKDESRVIKDGDILKIDLAAHIDGFSAVVAHTVIVGNGQVTGKAADVVQATWNAAEAALRTIKVGADSIEVTKVIEQVADEFGVNALQGIYSYQMKSHQLDGGHAIPNKIYPGMNYESFQFGVNEVYGIDIVFSTGEGKGRESEMRTTVFKRAHENTYVVKTQKGREFLAEVNKIAPSLCFSLRQIDDPLLARAGSADAKRHRLIEEFPVMKEKDGEVIAQFKFTVLLLPGGTKKVTGVSFSQGAQFASDKSVKDETLKALLASSTNPKKIKKKAAALAN